MRWPRALSSQLLLLQIGVVAATVLVGSIITIWLVRQQIDGEYEERSLAIAEAVARIPDILDAFDTPQPAAVIQPIAEGIRQGSGASFVVVANAEGIRYSHPNPQLIGQRVSTEPQALSGQPFVGIEQGTLGRSVRAKAPILGRDGKVIGQVSVGFLIGQIDAEVARSLPLLAGGLALSLGIGAVGSLLLARRLKRQTLGLEPSEIAALVEQREAVLHGIREGVLATDAAGRITLANDEARRLLGLDAGAVGRRVDEVIGPSPLRDVLTGARPGADEVDGSG